MIVIGRYKFYLEEAARLDANVFNISQDEWDASGKGASRFHAGKGIELFGQLWLASKAGRRSLGGCTLLKIEGFVWI
jgi:hypothetical protein